AGELGLWIVQAVPIAVDGLHRRAGLATCRLLIACQHVDAVDPERLDRIAALEDEQCRLAQVGDHLAPAQIVLVLPPEPRYRILLERIEAERHAENLRRELLQPLHRSLHRRLVGIPGAVPAQRQVQVEARALALAGLVREAEEKRIFLPRIGMDRDREYVVAP